MGITQEKFAWTVGLGSKGYMSRIESGERLPSVEVLDQIARALGVEVRDLFIFPDRSDADAAMEAVRLRGASAAIKTIKPEGRRK